MWQSSWRSISGLVPLLSSPAILLLTSLWSSPLTRTYSITTSLWHFPHSLVGQKGIRGGVCDLSLSFMEGRPEECQETCAISLTRVWMSWRHKGHVSNCKAHSIQIPLKKNRKLLVHQCLKFQIVQTVKKTQFRAYPCPQGRSSVSAMTSQHSVQQFSRMLTCFNKASRLCLQNKETQIKGFVWM